VKVASEAHNPFARFFVGGVDGGVFSGKRQSALKDLKEDQTEEPDYPNSDTHLGEGEARLNVSSVTWYSH
jgi:hypothetical protein